MRVLMLGMNVASQMSITVRALRRIGVDADGLVCDANPIFSREGLRDLAHGMSRLQRLRAGFLSTSWSWSVVSAIVRADVIHWNYGLPALEGEFDIRLAHLLRKAGVVEFWGSDIRISDIAAQRNPYYAARVAYEYEQHETMEGSYARQAAFGSRGVKVCLAPPWFDSYIAPDTFDEIRPSFARLLLDEFPEPPPSQNRVPLIAHAPSARGAKGTDAVLSAVERLRAHSEFEFVLLHGLPRRQVLDVVRTCDIFLDQFVIGEYGMAALEAMAFGKPVVCYLRQEVIDRSPGRLPIVNATGDDLYQRIRDLLENPGRRRAIGAESRRYIEQHHDAIVHARRLTELYEDLLAAKARGKALAVANPA